MGRDLKITREIQYKWDTDTPALNTADSIVRIEKSNPARIK